MQRTTSAGTSTNPPAHVPLPTLGWVASQPRVGAGSFRATTREAVAKRRCLVREDPHDPGRPVRGNTPPSLLHTTVGLLRRRGDAGDWSGEEEATTLPRAYYRPTRAVCFGRVGDMEKVLLAFAGVSLLASLVPGPDTAMVVKTAVTRGRRSAMATAAGCSTGQVGWGLASLAGIAALLAASVVVFSVVKWVGVAYLCYLGARSLLSAAKGRRGSGLQGLNEPLAEMSVPAGPWTVASRSSYLNGLLTNALNPKTALFMSALLPQFLGPGQTPWLPLALVAITATVSMTLMTCYGVAFAWLGDVLRRPHVKRMIEAVTGAVLVGFGVRLAFERP